MLVNHILEDYSISSGGLRTVVHDLDYYLKQNHIDSCIISTKAEEFDDIVLAQKEMNNGIWCYSKELKEILLNSNSDIFHIHGVWMYPQYLAAQLALKKHIPYIITPHGMLEPWLWEKSKLKKRLYFNFMMKKGFEKASCIHAITEDEKNNLFNLLKHKNIEVIPNSISYTQIDSYQILRNPNEKYILFVGRLHPKKGIDLLIKAFSHLKSIDVKLKIVGSINEYKKELDILITELNLNSKIEFLGLVSGKEKYQLYKDAWVFVAPSYSEVVGMVNLEAGIVETPVITTYQTGLYKEWSINGGILINPNINELTNALNQSMSWSESERNERGKKLKEFIIEKYSWEKNINKWLNIYSELK